MKVVYNDSTKAFYDKLFQEASEDTGMVIQDLVSYYKNLDSLRKINSKYIRIPCDEEYFKIDLNTRKIHIPAEFNTNGIGVQGDHTAETLFFIADRYFDDIDLAMFSHEAMPIEGKSCRCIIQWENEKGEKGYDRAYAFDVKGPKENETEEVMGYAIRDEKEEDHDVIIFGWVLRDDITKYSGKIKFSVKFEIVNEEDQSVYYSLNTQWTSCNIISNLIAPMAADKPVAIEDISDQMNNRPSFSGIFDSTLGPKPYITDDLEPYADLDENGEVVLSVQATTNDMGELKYQWVKNGVYINPTDESKPNEYVATEVGNYKVFVGNQYNDTMTRWIESNLTRIPEASEVEFVTNLGDKGYSNQLLSVTVDKIENSEIDARGVNGTISYSWKKDGTEVSTGTSTDNPAVITYQPAENEQGQFTVDIFNSFNNDTSKTITSNEMTVKAPAHKPENVVITYNADKNLLTATVTTEFNNDLRYVWSWVNKNESAQTQPMKENTYQPTVNAAYSCRVYQHIFEEDELYSSTSDNAYSSVIEVEGLPE